MDIYKKMGDQLRSLFNDIFDPRLEGSVRQKMTKILALAKEIGGKIQKEAELLNKDVTKFLEKPSDPKLLKAMKKHALHLERETREL